MDTTLSPTSLFSPSRARQQRAQAADWAQIDSWLSYKYAGRTIPSFERNDDTLKALRELSMANERADEERMVQERLEREACKELEEKHQKQHAIDTKLLTTLTTSLTPAAQTALTSLSSTSTALNTPTATTSPESLAHALISHTATTHKLSQHLQHIHTLQSYLQTQISLLHTDLHVLTTNPSFAAPPSLSRQTAEHVRQTKSLRSKIREYEDRLSALSAVQSKDGKRDAESGSVEAIAQILEQQEKLDELRGRVEGLEREVKRYAGLPAEKDAARREVGRLEVELDGVRRRRDGLFEGLVDK